MTGIEQRRLRATLTFTPAGDLEGVLFMAGNDWEEAILRQAISPALKAIGRRQRSKRTLLWTFNHGFLSERMTQRLFDFFHLRSA